MAKYQHFDLHSQKIPELYVEKITRDDEAKGETVVHQRSKASSHDEKNLPKKSRQSFREKTKALQIIAKYSRNQ